MALQSLILPILSVFRSAGLQQASGVLRKLTGDVDSLAGKLGLAAGSFSAFSALTSARQFTIDAVNATAQFERNILGLQQVFEQVTPQMRAFTQQVENYGLSQGQAAQASVFLGSVLKQYGFSVQQSADQTEKLVTLAQDLATTYGYDLESALLAITALFRGEYDPIEKFGVAMKQSEVNARLAAEGLSDLEGPALANAQATARLTMLFERAGDAVGAFSRASDTLYASQQRLNAIIGNLQLAFGEPLQKPLAEINNLFADLAQKYGPEVEEIGGAIASAIGSLVPVLGLLGTTFFQLIAPLEQIIEILAFAVTILTGALSPAIILLNGVLGAFNGILNVGSSALGAFNRGLSGVSEEGDQVKLLFENLGIDPDKENSLESYIRRLNLLADWFDRLFTHTEKFNSGLHQTDLQLIATATAAANAANAGSEIEKAFQGVATGAVDAEGKLGGLAGAFQRINDSKEMEQAKQDMEQLGLSAAFIEEALKRPNWKEIFAEIAYYARLAAIDTTKLYGPLAAEGVEKNMQDSLNRLNKLWGETDLNKPAGKAAKDSVQTFFDTFKEEAQKQVVRTQLALRGASEGLIEALVNAEGWMKLWIQIKQGRLSLQDLQKQFNQTAAGVKEIEDTAQAAADAWQKYYDQVAKVEEEWFNAIDKIQKKTAEAKQVFADLVGEFKIIPTEAEVQFGRFEKQIVDYLASIQQSLQTTFENGMIYQKAFNRLKAYTEQEGALLQQIAKQRDDLVGRYEFADELIKSYESAFKATLNLTNMFSKLQSESEKRSITEVQKGIVALGNGLRQFEVSISRTYEGSIDTVTEKSAKLLQSFRDMGQRARDFAANLRILREMQIDPELFQQLVDAGVDAGAATAEALVAGGPNAISEINAIYKEINDIGSDLGEEVATTLYGTGIDLADGLLAGIKSKQEELEQLAITMAETFNAKFQESINKAINDVSEDQQEEVNQAYQAKINAIPIPVDQAALNQVNALISNANAFANNVNNAAQAAGAAAKVDIYEALRDQIRAGAQVDLSGVRPGMSSAELAAAAQASIVAPPITYNINVSADSRLGGSKAGEAVVETLQRFAATNGNFVVGVSG